MMGKAKSIPYSQDDLKELLDYNPDSGELIWRERSPKMFSSIYSYSGAKQFFGKRAGSDKKHKQGYEGRKIALGGNNYSEHRVVWLWMTGEQPPSEIDHVNNDGKDNRWCNLRDGSNRVNWNNYSKYRTNTSGISGVHWFSPQQKWRARVRYKQKEYHLGYFNEDDLDLAIMAVMEWRVENGFPPSHGTEFAPYLKEAECQRF